METSNFFSLYPELKGHIITPEIFSDENDLMEASILFHRSFGFVFNLDLYVNNVSSPKEVQTVKSINVVVICFILST